MDNQRRMILKQLTLIVDFAEHETHHPHVGLYSQRVVHFLLGKQGYDAIEGGIRINIYGGRVGIRGELFEHLPLAFPLEPTKGQRRIGGREEPNRPSPDTVPGPGGNQRDVFRQIMPGFPVCDPE